MGQIKNIKLHIVTDIKKTQWQTKEAQPEDLEETEVVIEVDLAVVDAVVEVEDAVVAEGVEQVSWLLASRRNCFRWQESMIATLQPTERQQQLVTSRWPPTLPLRRRIRT